MNIIEFDNVYKMYKLYKNDKKRLLGLFLKKVKCTKKIASNYLTFKIKKGDRVAFMGPNGAGKSTVLKLITGVCFPNEGNVKVEGRVAALLELSAGFDNEFTGRENIYLKCQLLGISKKETKKLEKQIIDFADIGPYIDQPIRTYSSGMRARLGFSIIVHSKSDILIIDEALSVGDKAFKDKCVTKIREICASDNITVLFVTHSLPMAREFCTRGIILNKGHMVFDGDIDEAIDEYNRLF
ncbi:MAG TPA: ABC transporter ATP-binding protein [Tenericutes bacterium]|nr:ABC transporter ATP-binding protein [Mycoplasmatota bacterium]